MRSVSTLESETWPLVRLADLATTASGGTPRRDRSDNFGGPIPWVKSGELRDTVVLETSETLTEQGLRSSSAKIFPKGTLCIAMYGATAGKLGILGMDAATNQAICGIFPHEGVNPQYLLAFLHSKRSDLLEQRKGGAQPNISQAIIRDLLVPVPPLAQQRRLVEQIEEQLTRLDAGVAALNRVQANLKRYRATVLKTACEGRLVPTQAELARQEGRPYEPASALLARTPTPPRPSRFGSRTTDVILGHAALAVGDPETRLPEGWAWCALVDVARMESGHTPSREHLEWWGGTVPWIGLVDAREHHGRCIRETHQHTNDDGLANSAARLLPTGTVCVSRTASVGYVVTMGRSMATSQDFVNWVPTTAVTTDWLRLVFLADREAIRRFGRGSVHKTVYFPEHRFSPPSSSMSAEPG